MNHATVRSRAHDLLRLALLSSPPPPMDTSCSRQIVRPSRFRSSVHGQSTKLTKPLEPQALAPPSALCSRDRVESEYWREFCPHHRTNSHCFDARAPAPPSLSHRGLHIAVQQNPKQACVMRSSISERVVELEEAGSPS